MMILKVKRISSELELHVWMKCKIRIRESNDIYDCPSIQRISLFLEIYHTFNNKLNTQLPVINISNYLQINDYDSISLNNDFLHVHAIHMINDHAMQKLICKQLQTQYPCQNCYCYIQQRRHREPNNEFDDIQHLIEQ